MHDGNQGTVKHCSEGESLVAASTTNGLEPARQSSARDNVLGASLEVTTDGEANDIHDRATNKESSTSDLIAEDEYQDESIVDIFDVIGELAQEDKLISEAMGY